MHTYVRAYVRTYVINSGLYIYPSVSKCMPPPIRRMGYHRYTMHNNTQQIQNIVFLLHAI